MKRDWTDRYHDWVFGALLGIMSTAMGAYAGAILVHGVEALFHVKAPEGVMVGVTCFFGALGLSLWPVHMIGKRNRDRRHEEALRGELRKFEQGLTDVAFTAFEQQLARDLGTTVEQLRQDRQARQRWRS